MDEAAVFGAWVGLTVQRELETVYHGALDDLQITGRLAYSSSTGGVSLSGSTLKLTSDSGGALLCVATCKARMRRVMRGQMVGQWVKKKAATQTLPRSEAALTVRAC